MKKSGICLLFIFAVIFGAAVAADSYFNAVSVSETFLASAEYGSCKVHTYNSDYIVISEPTCSDKGVKWRSCSVCGYRDIVETDKNPDNHSLIKDDWIYFPSPTCISGGTKYKVCMGCNKQIAVTEVPADPNAHAASGKQAVIIPATCSSEGVVADICKYCNGTFNETSSPVDPENHVAGDSPVWDIISLPTCTEEGVYRCYCSLCGQVAMTKKFEPTGAHISDNIWHTDKEPNCTETGISANHCEQCGISMNEKEIPVNPDAHVYSVDFITDIAATCVSKGEKSKHCEYCGKRTEITEIGIDYSAHSYGTEWIVDREATCSEMGLMHKVCTLCGEPSIPVASEKTDHIYGDYEVIAESADGLSAKVKYTCTVCQHEKEDIITYSQNGGVGDIGDGDIGESTKKQYKLNVKESSVIKVDLESFTISNVARNMKVSVFTSNFININSCVIYNLQQEIIAEEDYIATGYRVNYEDINGIVTNYYVSVTGDVDGDGMVAAADARLILRAAAEMENFSNAQEIAADTDNDGKITAADARKTLRVSANIEFFESTYKN